MQLKGRRLPLGSRGGAARSWRTVALLVLILAGVLLIRLRDAGEIEPLFLPTPTPTRTAVSHQQEAEAHFSAGDLAKSIAAYQQAVLQAPDRSDLWAELARVQTYSSALLTTPEETRARLAEARESIDQAVAVNEDDARAWAIRILVYDWSASAAADFGERERMLLEAGNSAATANRLDPNDPLMVAFTAELYVDEQRFEPAINQAEDAIELDPNSMDVYRVYGTVLESNGRYDDAIRAYLQATEINPNLTFLYLRIGANHRRLGRSDQALEYFDRAAMINAQLGISDPVPYLAIGRTYLQDGQFFIAARNLESAVSISPNDPELLGFLGIIYLRARNYEFAELALRCAVFGCELEDQAAVLCDELAILDCSRDQPDARMQGITGLRLEDRSLEYYYSLGSVLASNNQCSDAEIVFQQLQAGYRGDPIVDPIVAEGRALCGGAMPEP